MPALRKPGAQPAPIAPARREPSHDFREFFLFRSFLRHQTNPARRVSREGVQVCALPSGFGPARNRLLKTIALDEGSPKSAMKFDPRKSIGCRLTALAVAGALVGLSGCSSHVETKRALTAETSNLKPLSILYGQYTSRNENRAPANEADFKKFIQTSGQWMLEQFKTDIDTLFVSSRDGQPYVVFYRDNPPPASGIVAYERVGVGGERLVAQPFGGVEAVDDARFRELVPNAP
ncbi:MAG: hypothetical protein L0228_09740 [Planctomycetes bacterium]|nr:hypothetical protein [Planctomycetota bacterium]